MMSEGATMRTRYFVRRLVRYGYPESPLYVFRILPTVAVEIYDLRAHAWMPRALEPYYRWAGIFDGEIGVDEIEPDEALAIIRTLDARGPDTLAA
jgi:hypothetical protein